MLIYYQLDVPDGIVWWMTIRRSQWSRDVSRETKKEVMMCDQLAREGMLDTWVEPSPCLANIRPGFRSS